MTLYQVEIRTAAGARVGYAEMVRPGPRIRCPFEGDRFTVYAPDGVQHAGVVTAVEDCGVTRGARLVGGSVDVRGRELRVLRLTLEQPLH